MLRPEAAARAWHQGFCLEANASGPRPHVRCCIADGRSPPGASAGASAWRRPGGAGLAPAAGWAPTGLSSSGGGCCQAPSRAA